jgi:hypothetical protein
MPKPPGRHNPKLGIPTGKSPDHTRKPSKINDLLSRSAIGGAAIRAFVDRQESWESFFTTRLEPALLAAVGHYVEKDGTLTIFVTSAAWAARMRYALPALWPAAMQFRPAVSRWVVKVQPAAASTGART